MFRDYLSVALEVRQGADYGWAGVSHKIAQRQVRRAALFVTAVRGTQRMIRQPSLHDTRVRLDALLTELTLYAKALLPGGGGRSQCPPV
jgi:hypothetical protein